MQKNEWFPTIGDLVWHRQSRAVLVIVDYDYTKQQYKVAANERKHNLSLLFIRKVCRPYWVSTNVVIQHGNGLWEVNKVTLLKNLDVVLQLAETNGSMTTKHADYVATKREHRVWTRKSSSKSVR